MVRNTNATKIVHLFAHRARCQSAHTKTDNKSRKIAHISRHRNLNVTYDWLRVSATRHSSPNIFFCGASRPKVYRIFISSFLPDLFLVNLRIWSISTVLRSMCAIFGFNFCLLWFRMCALLWTDWNFRIFHFVCSRFWFRLFLLLIGPSVIHCHFLHLLSVWLPVFFGSTRFSLGYNTIYNLLFAIFIIILDFDRLLLFVFFLRLFLEFFFHVDCFIGAYLIKTLAHQQRKPHSLNKCSMRPQSKIFFAFTHLRPMRIRGKNAPKLFWLTQLLLYCAVLLATELIMHSQCE